MHDEGFNPPVGEEIILKWANVWHEEAAKKGVTVPKFVQTKKARGSDICTELKGFSWGTKCMGILFKMIFTIK